MQKLILIYGFLNSGKTLLFDLFKGEDNFICFDLAGAHYPEYKDEIIKQIGIKNTKRIEPLIKNYDIFLPDIFFKEIGRLMKQFPQHNFVIKPASDEWAQHQKNKIAWWEEFVKKYTPLNDVNDILHLFAIRHPKIGWITTWNDKLGVKGFVKRWSGNNLIINLDAYQVVKIEDIACNELIKKLIKKTKLKNVLPYTRFDLETKLVNSYENLTDEYKYIENSLGGLFKYLKYNKNNKYISKFMNDSIEAWDIRRR